MSEVRIVNDPVALALQIEKAGRNPEVVLEATYGWYWAADTLQAAGANVHLAHPLGVKGFRYRRVKNDVRDAGDLADLVRMHRLPEAWIAPPATRELRELVRYRAKLVALRSGLKAQVHSVLAKSGVLIPVSDLFGVTGRQKLARVPLADAYAQRVISLLELIDVLDAHEARFTAFDRHRTAWRPRVHGDRGAARCRSDSGRGVRRARSGMCTGSPIPRTCAPGLAWRPNTVNPTQWFTAGTSRSRAASWCAGRRSRPSNSHPAGTKISVDRARIEARRGKNIAKSPRHENCSPWSTTG